MDVSNDSDDSAFLFLPTSMKRKASKENSQKAKQVRLSSDGENESAAKEETSSPICIQISSGSSTESKDKETNVEAEEKSGFLETLKDVKKKITATCPLCLKVFDNSNSHISHMKQCAKKRKMTTQQLLGALELQKKQMEERRALGLSSQVPVSEVKKTNATRKKVQSDVDPESNFQLALALAMSKSLEDHNSSKACSSQMDLDKDKDNDNVIEAQKTTLEKFGFTSSSSAGVQGTGKKKWKRSYRSILKERTKEDRDKIVSEKASGVLLDEDVVVDVPNRKEEEFLDSLELLKYKNEGKRLWNNSEDEKIATYYVEDIKDKVVVEEKGNSQKSTQFIDVLSCGSSLQSQDIQNEITKLNLPKNSFSQSWEKMINNQEFSDVSVRSKDEKIVYLHSLVLHVRNPSILSKDYKTIFENFNFLTIISFVEFLYCGILNRNLPRTEVENLFKLAESVDFKELVSVLSILKDNLKLTSESSEGFIPPSPEVAILPSPIEHSSEKDWPMDDMVDLTQSSRDSPVEENPEGDISENESNLEKSYWSFMEHERREKELEELRKQEEEKENIVNTNELYKIEEIMKKQKEYNQSLLEEEEENYKNKLELEKIYGLNLNENNDEERDIFDEEIPKNLDEEDIFQTPKKKIDKSVVKNEDCIVLSSDSNDEENTERLFKKSKSVIDLDYEIPQFDPYDNFNDISFNATQSDVKNNIQSQSLVTGSFSPISSIPQSLRFNLEETPKGNNVTEEQIVEETPMRLEKPEFFSTPIPDKTTLKNSSTKKSGRKKTDLTSSRILRNSVRLSVKSRMLKKNFGNRRSGRKSITEKKKRVDESAQVAEILTKSVLNEFNNTMAGSSTTPMTRSGRNYIEMTPKTKNIEYSEKVTPMPDYSVMQASTLKKHLSKYGLKRSLAKSKAKKILRHIYEELHPVLNTETGKIVKYVPEEKPRSKRTRKGNQTSIQERKPAPKKSATSSLTKKKQETPKKSQETPPKNSVTPEKVNGNDSDVSIDSMNKSTDCDSGGSEYDLDEPLTQFSSADEMDLPTAFNDFIQNNPEYHRKILLYEPIWLEELQNLLFVNFSKKFKLSDLMDFLDKQCITFRSEAQKKNNQKRNEKKKASPKKKQNKSPKKSRKARSSLSFDDG